MQQLKLENQEINMESLEIWNEGNSCCSTMLISNFTTIYLCYYCDFILRMFPSLTNLPVTCACDVFKVLKGSRVQVIKVVKQVMYIANGIPVGNPYFFIDQNNIIPLLHDFSDVVIVIQGNAMLPLELISLPDPMH